MMAKTTGKNASRHVCLISGGKDSTALALYMRDKHPELDMEYVFCDTGEELPETYEYLTRIEAYLGKPVTRLSPTDVEQYREGAFRHYLKMYRDFLPSPQARWCTRRLKIEPFEAYIDDDPVRLYVGIRADENRDGYISTKPNIEAVFPFKEAGVIKEDVMRILEQSGVGVPKYYDWRSRSGCYFCFFQRKIEWVGLHDLHPDMFEKAKSFEKPEIGFTWVQGESLDDILARRDQIEEEEQRRRERAEERRRNSPKTLAELFGGTQGDLDEEVGCLICHL
jgi:3'-phosphoadenosine 5'-phosphosulfate sulfotransferase (PAPS reductase)/FAD synthetase